MFCYRGSIRPVERCKPVEPKKASTPVSIYMYAELELALRRRADEEGVSISKLVRTIIEKEAKKWHSTSVL